MSGQSSRTGNTIKNATSSLFAQGLTAVLQFVCRSIFIKCLGNSYLSFDGLFSNILTMLSLAELGFGEAIIFCLYKPLAENDKKKIKALMDYYAKVYKIVSCVILLIGICVIPFFPYIMKDPPAVKESIYIIYFLFLLNTVSSYLLIYKQSILIADQKSYIVNSIKMFVSIITIVIQIIFLLLTKNYIVYLVISIAITIFTNVAVSIFANKKYPAIKEKAKVNLDSETRKTISINVKSLLLYKIGTMLVTGVDNLLISSFIGVLSVGIYSNYSLVINKAGTIFRTVVTSSTGSIGNLNATETNDYKEKICRVMLFVTFWVFGFASVGMFILINPFIVFMAGEEYLFNTFTVLFLTLDFYLLGANSPMNVFRNAMGLYRYGKYRPMICAFVNLVVSLALIKPLGITGVVLGTFAARFGVTSWYEPLVVYKYGLNMKWKHYITRFLLYFLTTLAICGLCYVICLPFSDFTVINFVIKTIVVTIVTNSIFILAFRKTEEFVFMCDLCKRLVKKVIKRKKHD